MFDSRAILQLFTDVMYGDVANHNLNDSYIAAKLQNMAGVYSREYGSIKVVDYNGVANRCAYLHKYAPLYTAIVCDTMRQILSTQSDLRCKLRSRELRICSLGGGPGTDVVGVLAALDVAFEPAREWHTFVSVVDYMSGWKRTFESVVNELVQHFSSRFAGFSWKYVQADLVNTRRNSEVRDAMSCSSLVTMVKCLSTFRDQDIQNVIAKVFRTMSFGSHILIIDDAVGGLTEIIMRTARQHNMLVAFGPSENTNYSLDELKVTRFGHVSCHQATVTSLLLMKPLIDPQSLSPPRYCVSCGNLLHMCSEFNRRLRMIRDLLMPSRGDGASPENESTPLVCSRSAPRGESGPPGGNRDSDVARDGNVPSGATAASTLVDSVIVELPE